MRFLSSYISRFLQTSLPNQIYHSKWWGQNRFTHCMVRSNFHSRFLVGSDSPHQLRDAWDQVLLTSGKMNPFFLLDRPHVAFALSLLRFLVPLFFIKRARLSSFLLQICAFWFHFGDGKKSVDLETLFPQVQRPNTATVRRLCSLQQKVFWEVYTRVLSS